MNMDVCTSNKGRLPHAKQAIHAREALEFAQAQDKYRSRAQKHLWIYMSDNSTLAW